MCPLMATNARGTWIGFLIMTFAVVGLTGLFASFAAPLPLERIITREQALDAALVAVHGPNPATDLASLRLRLDESAAALTPLGGDMDSRIARERIAMRSRLLAEADAVATRLRWMISVITIMGAAFGVAILHLARRNG